MTTTTTVAGWNQSDRLEFRGTVHGLHNSRNETEPGKPVLEYSQLRYDGIEISQSLSHQYWNSYLLFQKSRFVFTIFG